MNVTTLRVLPLFGLLAGAPLSAQTVWQQLAPANAPSPRYAAAMAYDVGRDRIVLWGGNDGSSSLGDTWEFDGASWLQRSLPQNPPAGRGMMCYDRVRARIVMVLWQSQGTATWEYDGLLWTEPSILSPSPSYPTPLVFDDRRGVAVMSSGADQVHEYDGSSWTTRVLPGPPWRLFFSLAYDPLRGRTILHGGTDFASYFSDTWEYDGTAWAQQLIIPGPHGYAGVIAFDSWRRRAVVFGGYSPMAGDTYEYDSTGWHLRNVSGPPVVVDGAMVYDEVRRRCVLFGGRIPGTTTPTGATWLHRAIDPAIVSPYGTGCSGVGAVVPLLQEEPYHVPYTGMSFSVRIDDAPNNQPASVAFGFSYTSLGGTPLPLSLQFLGMPNCSLRTSGEILLPAIGTGTTSAVAFPIPVQPALVGAEFFLQGFVFAPGANPAGLVTTRGLACTIGAP